MAVVTIPVPSQAHAEQTTTLDGVTYVLRFDYVQRLGRWRLGLYTSRGTLIVAPLWLVPGSDLLAPYRSDPRVPPGNLVVISSADPGRDSWGRTADLWYVEAPEEEGTVVEAVGLSLDLEEL